MSEINVRLSRLKTVISDLDQLEQSLDQPQIAVSKCITKGFISADSIKINAALKALSEDIIVEKAQIAKLSSALTEVVSLYESTEKQILDQCETGKAKDSEPATDAEKKGAIENALEILEEILGHDVMSFISAFVEALLKLDGDIQPSFYRRSL